MKKQRQISGVEYNKEMNETGRQLVFLADNITTAVQSCLYTLKLKNGNAHVGPTGRVVYDGNGNCVVFAGMDT